MTCKPTDNVEAYTLYLKGMHHWKRRNPEDVHKAVEIFNKTIEMDPQFASAQSGLSMCYSFLGSCGAVPPTDAYARALQYAITSIENDPDFAEGHLAMASLKFNHFWDWEGALQSLKKAEELGLNSATMHQQFGVYYGATGKAKEGIVKLRKALELDPLSVSIIIALGTLSVFAEEYDEALRYYNEALELDPALRSPWQYIGVVYACQKRYQDALDTFKEYNRRVGAPDRGISGLAISYWYTGDQDQTRELISRLEGRVHSGRDAVAAEIDLAIVHAGIGEFDQAMDYLESVYAKRISISCLGMIWVMRCPLFKEMWQEERYKQLMARMGF